MQLKNAGSCPMLNEIELPGHFKNVTDSAFTVHPVHLDKVSLLRWLLLR